MKKKTQSKFYAIKLELLNQRTIRLPSFHIERSRSVSILRNLAQAVTSDAYISLCSSSTLFARFLSSEQMHKSVSGLYSLLILPENVQSPWALVLRSPASNILLNPGLSGNENGATKCGLHTIAIVPYMNGASYLYTRSLEVNNRQVVSMKGQFIKPESHSAGSLSEFNVRPATLICGKRALIYTDKWSKLRDRTIKLTTTFLPSTKLQRIRTEANSNLYFHSPQDSTVPYSASEKEEERKSASCFKAGKAKITVGRTRRRKRSSVKEGQGCNNERSRWDGREIWMGSMDGRERCAYAGWVYRLPIKRARGVQAVEVARPRAICLCFPLDRAFESPKDVEHVAYGRRFVLSEGVAFLSHLLRVHDWKIQIVLNAGKSGVNGS
ncbi:hypothetical protein B0H16DRAFT_1476032 [Mycena metata]|uniref:Uncharacterized protein n=1 Tax=Mycena metata TaxID=1033252 RepID=A0AAD7HCG6_9AGAR|nr:hypothetical protein B0H16DRAFT_1476032 [Mycena metata]